MKTKIFLLIILMIGIAACSSSEQTVLKEKVEEEEIYVFDDIEKDSVELENKIIEETKTLIYIVQVGAFTTKEKAEQFIKENQYKLTQKMSIVFKNDINLFAVQLPELYKREEAEKLRNELWQISVFNDAFIITQER